MIAELRKKSQITIPKEIVLKLGLSEGDKFDVTERDGAITMLPVTVYPKEYVDELRSEINDIRTKIESGEQPVFDTVDALFERLEGEAYDYPR